MIHRGLGLIFVLCFQTGLCTGALARHTPVLEPGSRNRFWKVIVLAEDGSARESPTCRPSGGCSQCGRLTMGPLDKSRNVRLLQALMRWYLSCCCCRCTATEKG